MVKVDLITGFLGSGKTTFIKRYARHLIEQGQNIGILENDYGAVNVDMMLLQDLESDRCELEMVAGGCDYDCHKRRFKTKLIAMGMCGYDRVLIEPSGIFDVDEFFDVLQEEPLSRWYEIGSVITIVDASLEKNLSPLSNYLLASQCASAGLILFSQIQTTSEKQFQHTLSHIDMAMKQVKCNRDIRSSILAKNWMELTDEDYTLIQTAGCSVHSFEKRFVEEENAYSSLYYLEPAIKKEDLLQSIQQIFQDSSCGNVFRIKGFLQEKNSWVQINVTQESISAEPVPRGQSVLIIIGENLNQKRIDSYLFPPNK